MEMIRGLAQWLRERPVVFDTVVAVLFTGSYAAVLRWQYGIDPSADLLPPIEVSYAFLALIAVLLSVRRRWPAFVLVATALTYGTYLAAGLPRYEAAANATLIAIFGVGAYLPARRATAIRGVTVVALLVYLILLVTVVRPTPAQGPFYPLIVLVLNGFFYGAAWLTGDIARAMREQRIVLEARTSELERERDERARRAVSDERVRIARELHDVVAHHVSVMGLQAGAARRVLERHPDQAIVNLAHIEATSREAIGEMDRVLDMLRGDAPAGSSPSPQPTLRELDALAETTKRAGLDVTVEVVGRPFDVPPGLDLSAYRIVQEALTNVLKHARARKANVVVQYGDGVLDLTVADDGTASSPTSSRPGMGLIGMRERVSLYSGELSAGPRPSGGYLVHARLPVPETAA